MIYIQFKIKTEKMKRILGLIGKQICTKLPIKAAHQINENRRPQLLPAVEQLLHVTQIPHFPLFHDHLHQILLEASARLFHAIVFLAAQFYVRRSERRRKRRSLVRRGVGEARELRHPVHLPLVARRSENRHHAAAAEGFDGERLPRAELHQEFHYFFAWFEKLAFDQ